MAEVVTNALSPKGTGASAGAVHTALAFPSADRNYGIPASDVDRLETNARLIGGDFGMKVSLGAPGGGSFMDPVKKEITLDPLHLRESPAEARFVPAHEGGHAAIDRDPEALGVSKELVRELYAQLGFGYVDNVIKDCADNDWICRSCPGVTPDKNEVYNRQFDRENAVLGTPEVHELARRLGRWPKFAHFGSEVLRDWHNWRKQLGEDADLSTAAGEGSFSKTLDPEVEKALKETIGSARSAASKIPSPLCRDEREIIERAREKFKITVEEVWPAAAKLVEEDLKLESIRQAANGLGEKGGALSGKAREEIKKAAGAAVKQHAEDFAKSVATGFGEIKESRRKQQALDEEIEALEAQTGQKGAGSAAEELTRKRQDKALEEARERRLREQLEKDVERAMSGSPETEDLAQKIKDKIAEETKKPRSNGAPPSGSSGAKAGADPGSGAPEKRFDTEELARAAEAAMTQRNAASGDQPLPFDKLSDETRRELEKMYESLDPKTKSQAAQKAKEELEKFEDALNEGLESKLNPRRPNHAERKKNESAPEAASPPGSAPFSADDVERVLKAQEHIEEARLASLTPYERAAEEMSDYESAVLTRLRNAARLCTDPEWETGRTQGYAHLPAAMQGEADPRKMAEIWKQRNIFTALDHTFAVLRDVSTSMAGKKAEQCFKGSVLVTSLFARLKIKNAVYDFSDDVQRVKSYKDSIRDEEVQARMTSSLHTRGGTKDAAALHTVYEEIKRRPEQYKFILVFSDTDSNELTALTEVIERIKAEKKVIVIHYGLGPNTKDTHHVYPYSQGNLKMRTANDPRDADGSSGFFDEVLADSLAEMLMTPEKYLQYKDAEERDTR